MATPDRGAARAAHLLGRVFAGIDTPLAFRLWDGTTARFGPRDGGFFVVFPSPAAFRRVLLHPTPLRFGEAYISGEIDIEGDLFAAMRAADAIEHLPIPLATRLAALAALLRV